MTALQDIPVNTIRGDDAALRDYAGQVLLVVNVASKCGLTPQYAGLEALYSRYRERGFAVLGFPANDFGNQEPGADAEIADFCVSNYAVDFPMFAKIQVSGDGKHPLYAALTQAHPTSTSTTGDALRAKLVSHGVPANPEPEVLWNFEKFLIGRDGSVVARFGPDTAPDNPALVAAIEAAL